MISAATVDANRPSWVLWPQGSPLPPYVTPLLAALRAYRISIPTEACFCPDGLAVNAEAADGRRAVVALPGDLSFLQETTPDDAGAQRQIDGWVAAGATLLVPTAWAMDRLARRANLDPRRGHAWPLPLPTLDPIGPVTPLPVNGHLAIDRPIWELLYPYLRAMRMGGFRGRFLLVADDALPHIQPGGEAVMADFVPGLDIGAVATRDEALAGARAVVRLETHVDAGWSLRELLASGRPVVVNGDPVVREHLRASGGLAYLHPGPHDPVQAAVATLAALKGTRGPVHEVSRAGVFDESWSRPARLLAQQLSTRPEPLVGRWAKRPRRGEATLRIAVVAPPHRIGSAERFLREVLTAMAASPREVAVTLLGAAERWNDAVLATEGALLRAGGRAIDVGPEGISGALTASEGEFDVIWCPWPHTVYPPESIAPVVTTVHDLNWRFFWSFERERTLAIEDQMPRWIDATALFVSSSEYIRDQLCSEYELPKLRTRVVPLTGMRPIPLDPKLLSEMRRRLLLPNRFLLFPASGPPHKNPVALVRALELLRASGHPQAIVTTSHVADLLFHGPDLVGLGYVTDEELHMLYALSDGLVTTTLYEAGSFPIFEAMMVGRPVACSRIPPLVEQLGRDGATAELFDPTDPADIAAALDRLRRLRGLRRRRLVDRNRRAVSRRTWSDVANAYLDVFREAVDRPLA